MSLFNERETIAKILPGKFTVLNPRNKKITLIAEVKISRFFLSKTQQEMIDKRLAWRNYASGADAILEELARAEQLFASDTKRGVQSTGGGRTAGWCDSWHSRWTRGSCYQCRPAPLADWELSGSIGGRRSSSAPPSRHLDYSHPPASLQPVVVYHTMLLNL
jgi:hypothetical protein